jgi:hypothetical protein
MYVFLSDAVEASIVPFKLNVVSGAKTKGADITCPFCRAKWPAATVAAAGGRVVAALGSDGYLNLATAAGLSPVRDTSSCQYAQIILSSNNWD